MLSISLLRQTPHKALAWRSAVARNVLCRVGIRHLAMGHCFPADCFLTRFANPSQVASVALAKAHAHRGRARGARKPVASDYNRCAPNTLRAVFRRAAQASVGGASDSSKRVAQHIDVWCCVGRTVDDESVGKS